MPAMLINKTKNKLIVMGVGKPNFIFVRLVFLVKRQAVRRISQLYAGPIQ
jgi:hypothetical protein